MEEHNQPNISLIMINHNRSEYIEEAIASVINQTSPNWELIIIDDASSDNSVEIIKKYLDNKKIKLSINNHHEGIVYCRIRAIENSQNEIIGIIDSDDVLDKNAVKIMTEQHQKNRNGLIYSQMMVCDKDLKQTSVGTNKQILPNSSNLIENCISHFVTFKKSDYKKINGYDPLFNSCAEDKDLFYKLEEVTDPLFVNEILYYYRMNPLSVSSYGTKKLIGRILYFLAKFKAYQRRIKNNSPKKIKFIELLPLKRLQRMIKLN
jgi:glycosyltransferase involved in cell wall biosynthesis